MIMRPSLFCLLIAGCFLFTDEFASAEVPPTEVAALTTLYNATAGDEWYRSDNWLVGDPCENQWYGVGCDVFNTSVTSLDLGGDNLQGILPDVFGDLIYLTSLEITSCRHLSGEIPRSLFESQLMLSVSLRACNFTGSIPELQPNSTMSELNLASNKLSSSIPASILASTTLVTLDLSNNYFTGSLPDTISANNVFNSIELDQNKLSGELPLSLVANTLLQTLYVEGNLFSGVIPDAFQQQNSGLSRRQYFFSFNQFESPIPSSLLSIPDMDYLNLQSNLFTGTLPDAFPAENSGYELVISDNQLESPLPPSLLALKGMYAFVASDNTFTEVGEWIAEDTAVTITMDRNMITSLPTHFGSIKELSVSSNLLTGYIAADIDVGEMTQLDISDNEMSGSIPLAIFNLHDFFARSNYFSGSLPHDLDDLPINSLNLSYNNLSGNLHTSCPSAKLYELYGNCFSCPVPLCCRQSECQNDGDCRCSTWDNYWPIFVSIVALVCLCCACCVGGVVGLVALRKRNQKKGYEQLVNCVEDDEEARTGSFSE